MEVLLAVALIAVLAGGVLSFVWNLLDRREVLLSTARDGQAATALIDRIEADLAVALAGDEGQGGGIVGSADSLKILMRGVWVEARPGRLGGSDLQGAEYRFQRDSGVVTARRWDVHAAGGGGGAGESEPEHEVVSDRVERLRLRYFDGRQWRESFDSGEAGELPVAVEIAIWLVPPGSAGGSAAGAAGGSAGGAPQEMDTELGRQWREPDRWRIVVVPDGPVTAWRDWR